MISHQPFLITPVAAVATRQFSKSGNQQMLRVTGVGETWNSQAVAALSDAGHRVHVAAHIQETVLGWRRLWFVAQPETAELAAGVLMQSFNHAGSVVIASDEVDRAACQFPQGTQDVSQSKGEAEATMDQVAKDEQHLRAEAIAEFQKRIEGALIGITGQGNAVGLKHLGFAEVQV